MNDQKSVPRGHQTRPKPKRRLVMKSPIFLILMTLLCAATASVKSARSATITVVNTNDSGPGSLRDALAIANDGDKIDATGVSGTILLTSGELQVTRNVIISGPGAGNLKVDANHNSRLFENFASNVTISSLTITNGGSFCDPCPEQGGILNHGGLIVSDCVVSHSTTYYLYAGGGIHSEGTLTVTRSTIYANSSGSGGGIFSDGTLTVINSTISDNSAICPRCGGGGIVSTGQATVTNTVISGNSAACCFGGGIFNSGNLTVTNSTISGNKVLRSGMGGGIWNAGNLTVSKSTISDNWAPTASGILNSNRGAAQIGDTILNAGASGGTIANAGTFTSLGYNLASDNGGGVLTGPGDQTNTDPMLGPLQDNGGPTFTHALLPGSPAVEKGDPSFTPPPFYDQRGPGFDRVVNGRMDIGSFEGQARPTPTPTPTATPTPARADT
jgi:hypothetical protein